MAAVGLLIGWSEGVPVVLLAAPLALYLADTATVLAKRALRGDPLFEAHREHAYQRLVSEVGLSYTLVSGLTTIAAVAITLAWIPGFSLLGLVVTLVVLASYLALPAALAGTAKARLKHKDGMLE